jgi:hypothetical protein
MYYLVIVSKTEFKSNIIKNRVMSKFYIILLSITIPFFAECQNIFAGLKLGGNVSNIWADHKNMFTPYVHGNAGLYVKYYLNKTIFINPEIQYSRQGFTNEYFDYIVTHPDPNTSIFTGYVLSEYFRLNYLKAPVYIGIAPFKNDFNFQAGFYVAYLLNAIEKTNKDKIKRELNISSNFNKIDCGCSFGIRNEIKNGFNYGLGIDFGINNVFRADNLKNTNICYLLSAGFTLGKKKNTASEK